MAPARRLALIVFEPMPASSTADIASLPSLPERVRAFIALRLSTAPVEEAIAALIERLRSPDDGIRWIRRANFHLTLFFLGPSVPRERLAPIAEALGTIAAASAPFEIAARGVGVFPNLAHPRVVWVGLHSAELIRLAAQVTEAAVRCGFAAEHRRYSPHLTIGRVRALRSHGRIRRAIREEADSSFGLSRIERVVLYRSELGPESSIYHELAAFPFGG